MAHIKNYILGPNLETLNHRNIMFLIGNDFSYVNSTSDFTIENGLLKLLSQYSEEDLGVKINVKVATPSDYFSQIESEIESKKLHLKKYAFDFGQYDENTHHLDPARFRTMHRVDYWTGYHANRGAHKALIKKAFTQLEVTSNFVRLMQIVGCSKNETLPFCKPSVQKQINDQLQLYS